MRYLYFILLLLITGLARGQQAGLTIKRLVPPQEGPFLFTPSINNGLFHPTYNKKISTILIPAFKNPYRYQDDLGFFCRAELRWDKKLARPVRFRLGSYDYVNALESK